MSVGTIRERTPGHFEIRAYLGRSPSGTPRYDQETYVHHRKDGGIQAARARLKMLEGTTDKKKRSTATLGALLDDWLNHSRRIGRAESTIAGYERRVRRIKEALGDVELSKLTAKTFDTWYGELLEAGKSPADVKAYHRVISAALNQGERWESVERNIARRADPPRVPDADIEAPSPEQVELLIRLAQASKAPEMASIIFWAAITGMRRGEICGLHWNRVDWDESKVFVCRSVWQVNKRLGEKDTKSHQTRWVSIGKVGVALLRARLARATEDAAAVEAIIDPDGYVWSTDIVGGEPWHPDRITQAFKRLCQLAEKPARLAAAKAGRELSSEERWPYRLHDLRHYSATELLDAGVALPTVSQRLGHRRTSTTADIYGHGRESTDKKAAEILGRTIQTAARKALPK